MNRIVLGAVAALLFVAAGLFWLQGRAEVERSAPPLPSAPVASEDPEELPTADLGDIEGPDLPEASALSREQKRFARYDRDRDGRITRNELMSSRTAAFRKLDKDGNNLLTFEEWSVRRSNRFKGADANGDGQLDRTEFATTKPKPRTAPACNCAGPRQPGARGAGVQRKTPAPPEGGTGVEEGDEDQVN